MINQTISIRDIQDAIISIEKRAERVELTDQFSKTFVDTNIINLLTINQNQLIFGRRGTGKTHLLGTLKENYLDSFDRTKVLPIYIDGRIVAGQANFDGLNSGISILIAFRTFIEKIIAGIQDFINNNIVISKFDKIWPNGKKQKINRIQEIIMKLIYLIHVGEVQQGPGRVESHHSNTNSVNTGNDISAGVGIETTDRNLPKINAKMKIDLSKVSSKNVEESINIIYNGLTTMNYNKIGLYLDDIIEELELNSIAILLDEWSAINLEYQPFLADMIRNTLLSGRKMFIKFGCIPFLTRLSTYKGGKQPIGFPIGEEIFVDVDLDRIYNAWVDPEIITIFLLHVLQKHLGYKINSLMDAKFGEAYNYFKKSLFEDEKSIAELVLASAGVPRDFLRIFAKAFLCSADNLPITVEHIRLATHDIFQQEKQSLVHEHISQKANQLFDDLVDKICFPAETYIFFVSQSNSNNQILREIWHHRLVHLLFEGFPAFSSGKPGKFNVYAIDYGSYILLKSYSRGDEFLLKMQNLANVITTWFGSQNKSALKKLWHPNIDDDLKARFSRYYMSQFTIDSLDMASLFDDCSRLVADKIIVENKTNIEEEKKLKENHIIKGNDSITDPLIHLKWRFANGEINEEEFKKMKILLE